jgi:hypothetical protein
MTTTTDTIYAEEELQSLHAIISDDDSDPSFSEGCVADVIWEYLAYKNMDPEDFIKSFEMSLFHAKRKAIGLPNRPKNVEHN